LQGAAAAATRVTVTGSVPEVEPFLWQSAVAVAPLFVARGMQNKVIEAIAAGLPVVVTSQVADGLPTEALPACFVAGAADVFAREVLRLLALQPDARRERAGRADLTSLRWSQRLQPVVDIVRSLTDSN
jgi:glycosyltransferase involved in cell wall biosynthesis